MISNGYKTTFLNNKCKCSIFIFTDGNFFSFVDHSMERSLVTSAPWNGRKKILFSSLHNRTRTAQDGEWREKPSMWCFFLLTVRNFSLSRVNWNVLETAEKGSRNARRSSHIQKSSILYKKVKMKYNPPARPDMHLQINTCWRLKFSLLSYQYCRECSVCKCAKNLTRNLWHFKRLIICCRFEALMCRTQHSNDRTVSWGFFPLGWKQEGISQLFTTRTFYRPKHYTQWSK